MDQMLPTPSQELPVPNKGESQASVSNTEYHLPRPEIDGRHDSKERVSQANSAVAQANDNAAQLIVDSTQPIVLPVSIQDDISASNPTVANDGEVIEKEWVNGARQIVKETRHDPQVQANKITRFKHDYIKKRFGKEIKLPEDNIHTGL